MGANSTHHLTLRSSQIQNSLSNPNFIPKPNKFPRLRLAFFPLSSWFSSLSVCVSSSLRPPMFEYSDTSSSHRESSERDGYSDTTSSRREPSEKAEWDPAAHDEATRKALAEMIVAGNLPFSFLEQKGFKHFMSLACPKFQISSKSIVMADCCQMFLREKEKLREHLKKTCSGRVSLTIDRWKTLQHYQQYVCVTAHYIDNEWAMNKRILSFCPISGRNGLDIGTAVESCLKDWGIKEVFSITTDSGSESEVAINYLRDRFNRSGTSILGGKFLHVRCFAQIINLVAFDSLTEMSKSVDRVREAIRYIRQSNSRLFKFKQWVASRRIEAKASLRIDDPTNWMSTYLMLKSARKWEGAFNQFALMDQHDPAEDGSGERIRMPDETDWENVKGLVYFLNQLDQLAENISSSTHFASSDFLGDICTVFKALNDWIDGDDLALSQMAVQMKLRFEKWWGKVGMNSQMLFIAAILDPQNNFDFAKYAVSQMYEGDVRGEMGKQVKQDVHQLFQHYKSKYDPPTWLDSSSRKRGRARYEFDSPDGRDDDREGETELDWYLRERHTKWDDSFNVLDWWSYKDSAYPVLSEMARDVLAVPVTSTAPEAAFKAEGRVLDEFMSSLAPREAEALICTRNWLNPSSYSAVVGDGLGEMAW